MNELRPSIPGWILDYVALDGAEIYTDTPKVAQEYGRRHDNVMVRAREVVRVTGDHLNFQEIQLPDKYGRMQPAYRLTRDGFFMLALGFTGDKAIKLRAKFIEAFGWMARELLLRQMDEHERRDMQSKVAASMGSKLLHVRKGEKPALEAEERQLRAQLQLGLDLLP